MSKFYSKSEIYLFTVKYISFNQIKENVEFFARKSHFNFMKYGVQDAETIENYNILMLICIVKSTFTLLKQNKKEKWKSFINTLLNLI